MTDYQHLVLLVLAPTASLAFVGLLFLHRRRIYDTWAKIASIIAFFLGAGWGAPGFVLMYWRSYHLSRDMYYTFVGLKGMLGGITIGFTLSILMARPYRKKDIETLSA